LWRWSGDEAKRRKLQVGVDIPTPAEARMIIYAAQGRGRAPIIVTVFTGLRSSELRALRWTDIDLDGRALHVRRRVDRYGKFGPPKSEAGTRTIPLSPMVVNTLREWKLACPKGELDLVFPNSVGHITSHTDFVNSLYLPTLVRAGLVHRLVDDAGKPLLRKDGKSRYEGRYTGIHSLRHFYASWCINRVADGGLELPAKTVQVRLGHANIIMTLGTYGHLFPQADDHAALVAGERALLG
jgi:integrase